jgi:uncharacterized protein YjiS (DUF1127 family)
MCKVAIKTGTLGAAATLHTRRRSANDNVIDVPMAAGAEICGAFTPVALGGATVVHASQNLGMPTAVRRVTSDGEPLVSNTNDLGWTESAWIAAALDLITQAYSALRREWNIMRAASKLKGMSDWTLSDIGVQRGDIDFIVRHGRSTKVEG